VKLTLLDLSKILCRLV